MAGALLSARDPRIRRLLENRLILFCYWFVMARGVMRLCMDPVGELKRLLALAELLFS